MEKRGRSKEYTVVINSGSIVRFLLFGLLLVGLFVMKDLVVILLTAVVIASALEPVTKWFESYRIPRALTVVVMYLFIATMFTGVLVWLVPPLLADVSDLLSRAPEYIQSLETDGVFSTIGLTSPSLLESLNGNFSLPEILRTFQNDVEDSTGSTLGFVSGIFGGLFSFILIVTISFYLAVQKDGISSFLRIITPVKHESYIIDLWRRSQRKMGLWLQGQLVLMLIVGILVYVLLVIFGIPNALVLALLAALFELIPFVGPVLSAIPGIVAATLFGGLPLGLIAFGIYVFVQQFENHIIYPLVVKKVVGVPTIIVVVALVAGAELGGFLGIVLSVPIAAVIMEYVNDIERRKEAELLKIEKAKNHKKKAA